MNCLDCGAEMLTETVESYRYTGCGLSNVTIASVEQRRCPECGETEIVLPRIEELHKVIAQGILRKRSRLHGDEVRFLRKVLGLSGADFGKRMGVDPTTVSRWENDKTPIGPQADRLLRLMVVHEPVKCEYELDELANIVDEVADEPVRVARERKGWAMSHAPAA